MQRLPRRQTFQVAKKSGHLIVYRGVRLVGADHVFPLASQALRRIEFRQAIGQPNQADTELLG